ncbi:MAG: ATP-binding cassette domain-containing protein, partial [Anaerolineales bacterium]
MISVRLDKVSFSYPSQPILEEASCEIQKGCYGVIGLNGSGKTTLLKLIQGDLEPDDGFLVRDKRLSMAYMAQEVILNPEDIAFDAVRQGAVRILALKDKLTSLEDRFADPAYYTNEKKLARLIDQQEQVLTAFNQLGGPGLDGRVRNLLKIIGFNEHEMFLPVKHLSGGQKKLLGLVRILISQPDILLLDEPDNHLDLNGKEMLEELIQGFDGSVIIVSHDRYFLDLVVDEILEVEDGHIAQFVGNYSEYMFEKRLWLERQAERYQAQQKEISRLEQ